MFEVPGTNQVTRQASIGGTGTLPDNPTNLNPPALAGQTLALGTVFTFALPVSGAGAVEVVLRFSAVGAAPPTADIRKTLADGVTEKMSPVGASAKVAFGAAFANGVQQTASISTLRGEKVVLLTITTTTNAVTVDQAEYSTK